MSYSPCTCQVLDWIMNELHPGHTLSDISSSFNLSSSFHLSGLDQSSVDSSGGSSEDSSDDFFNLSIQIEEQKQSDRIQSSEQSILVPHVARINRSLSNISISIGSRTLLDVTSNISDEISSWNALMNTIGLPLFNHTCCIQTEEKPDNVQTSECIITTSDVVHIHRTLSDISFTSDMLCNSVQDIFACTPSAVTEVDINEFSIFTRTRSSVMDRKDKKHKRSGSSEYSIHKRICPVMPLW